MKWSQTDSNELQPSYNRATNELQPSYKRLHIILITLPSELTIRPYHHGFKRSQTYEFYRVQNNSLHMQI